MKNKILLVVAICSFCISFSSYSQGEGNFWYFGDNAGLNFNSGSPVPLTDGALVTNEGCAAISTSAGALLFYTDGITVWNNQHNAMPNGINLLGDPSATQSGIIVPKPGSSTIYYVFTVAAVGGFGGLCYSEVDMSLASGLGDVTSNKNIPLATPVTEKLTAVKKANNIDFWVIAHDFTTNAFLVFSVTSAGVNVTPITSNVGTVDNSSFGIGYLKASSDGNKLVQAIWTQGNIDILNFNTTTGAVTLDFTFNSPFSDLNPYGVEFSPDGTRLYIADAGSSTDVYQYNMTLGSSNAIVASATIIGTATASSGYLGALQIAPDGKIYLAKWGEVNLSAITNPNALGLACGFVDNAVTLAGRTSEGGLPNFVQSYFNSPSISSVGNCVGDSIQFALADTASIDSVLWSFGDSISGVNNTSVVLFPWHVYSDTGTYSVSVIIHAGSITDTLSTSITIHAPPLFSIGNDTVLCSNDTLVLNPGAGYLNYLWQNSSTNQTFTLDTAGIYYVNVTNSCGNTSDTIHITNIPAPIVKVNDTSVCALQTVALIAHGASVYTWPIGTTITGINTATATPSQTANYIVVGTDTITGCSNKDTATISVHQLPVPSFVALPTSGCAPLCVQFVESNGTNCTSQLFSFGNGDSSAIASPVNCYATAGSYSVTLACTDNNGCTGITTQNNAINVFPAITANFTISPSNIVKPNTSVDFTDSSTSAATVFWNFGDSLSGANDTSILTAPSHMYAEEGNYCITLIAANSNGCVDTASKCITVFDDLLNIPNVFTPNGDGNNDVFLIKHLHLGIATLKIYDRWGKIVFESNGYNNDWNGKNVNDGVFYYILDYPLNSKTYTGFIQVLSEK